MAGTIVAILVVVALAAYLIGIFVYDHFRRKRGAPSILLDECESEGRGKRLVRQFQKKYGKKGNLQ